MTQSPVFKSIVGVDFSAGIEAGRKVWITTAAIDDQNRLALQSVIRADALANSGLERSAAHNALSAHLASLDRALVGLDFPLSIPHQFLPAEGWLHWLTSFKTTHESADAFREKLVALSPTKEHKRACEAFAKTPFAAYNLRMYQQTYHGIADVVAPLVLSGKCVALPFQDDDAAKSALIETCPASYLKSVNKYLSYKGQSTDQLMARHKIYEHIIDAGLLAEPDDDTLRPLFMNDEPGDALDSLLCAVCALRALKDGDLSESANDLQKSEGRVYF
jgi:hypothetical protein